MCFDWAMDPTADVTEAEKRLFPLLLTAVLVLCEKIRKYVALNPTVQ